MCSAGAGAKRAWIDGRNRGSDGRSSDEDAEFGLMEESAGVMAVRMDEDDDNDNDSDDNLLREVA